MSERERLRRLHVENRLEELAHKYGPLERRPPPEPDINPSWGVVGSWLRRTDAALYEQVLRQHQEILGQVLPEPEQATLPRQQKPAERWTWDEYGESPVLGCVRCGEHSAKANIRIDLWNCTACGAHGKASAWFPQTSPPPPDRRLPATRLDEA